MVKVCVIIPAYNGRLFIRKAVDSVLAQTFKDYKIIVVDDGSVDGTKEVLASYREIIQYIRQDNTGISAARNTGILNSKSEYVAFLNQDDLWLPDKLEAQVKFLDENLQVGLLFSDMYLSQETKSLHDLSLSKRWFQMRKPFRGNIFRELFVQNFIPSPTVIIRRACLDKSGLFDPTNMAAPDYDLWLRIARFSQVDYIEQPLAIYRFNARSISQNVEKALESNIVIRKKLINLDPSILNDFDYQTWRKVYYLSIAHLGWLQIWKGNLKKARKYYRQYIQLDPSSLQIYILFAITYIPYMLVSKFKSIAQYYIRYKSSKKK